MCNAQNAKVPYQQMMGALEGDDGYRADNIIAADLYSSPQTSSPSPQCWVRVRVTSHKGRVGVWVMKHLQNLNEKRKPYTYVFYSLK